MLNRSSFKVRPPQNLSSSFAWSAAFLSTLTVLGCNAKPSAPVSPIHVENVSVNTSTGSNNDEMLDFSITLSTGTFTVAATTLPILNPNNPSIEYGSLSLRPVLCSTPSSCPYGNGAQVGVNLDITSITSAKGIAPLLPNGSALPVGGLQNSTVIALPIANTGAEVYFASGKGVAMLGTAIPFAQMNVVGQTIPGANLFIPVTVSTSKGSFTLLPGIFTGSTPNTTGIGFFADLSGIIPQSTLLASLTETPAQLTSTAMKSNLVFPVTSPSKKKLNRLYEELLQLNAKGGYLNLQ